jgi:ubiquinone/menaquinone biosynthesis C-methylase UbiE
VKTLDDLTRLRNEYENRKQRFVSKDIYSWFNQAQLFALQQRQRAVLSSLKKYGFNDLSDLKILEMGSGCGGVLTEFLAFGATPGYLFGIDLLADRLVDAHQRLPASGLANANGQFLPFPAGAFDLVMQFTAISSVLDPVMRHQICLDMLRVLRPGGIILSYDFWLNPTNPQTHGIRPNEIRRLFPGCRFEFHRITLAPPLTRKLVKVSWALCLILEKLKIFNSHYLVIISSKDRHNDR